MSSDQVVREETDVKVIQCLGWLMFFGLLTALAGAFVDAACGRWMAQDELRQSRIAMAEQMEQLRQGEIRCLVQPDPKVIDELLADANCAAKISEIDLGGDLSDERLGRLRDLPNVKCIVLLFAHNPCDLLERLQGMDTVEEIILEHSYLSRHGIEFLRTFPKLKSLCLPVSGKDIGDLDGIKNHASLENLVLTRIGCDERLLPILRSLPRLRTLTIEDAEKDAEAFERSLRIALPHCRCTVKQGR